MMEKRLFLNSFYNLKNIIIIAKQSGVVETVSNIPNAALLLNQHNFEVFDWQIAENYK